MTQTHIILDTNVFVAAGFNPGSSSARILNAVEAGDLRLVWNEATRRETEAILRKIPPLSWERWARLFRDSDRYQGDTHPQHFIYVTDPDDRKFAALAAATGGTLVTNDEHLLAHREQADLTIRSPAQFWEDYQRQSDHL
jgi:predicted nucleic acid-binding protein